MVGWPTRWEPGVGRDHHHNHHHHLHHHQHPHHPSSSAAIAVTDQQASSSPGIDLPKASFVAPTPNHTHNNHSDIYHISQPSPSHLGTKGNNNCLEAGPLLLSGGSQDIILRNRTRSPASGQCSHPPDPAVVLNHNRYPLAIVSSSGAPPSCSSVYTLPEGGGGLGGHPVQTTAASSSYGSEFESPSSSRPDACSSNHSSLCHAFSSTPVVPPPTSVNGTSQPPGTRPNVLHVDDSSLWPETCETAPLTNTNGEVGRFRVNGVVTMPEKEEQMGEGEEEEEEEEDCEEEEEEDEEDVQCGLGKWCSPPCSQRLANKQMFLLVFCLTSVLQGMFYTYFVSVLTTIEKLFQLKSKTTGIIMSATEMGQIGGALLLTYYGGHGHRPKWIGWGVVLFALCAALCSLPHFLFGPTLLKRHLELTPSASPLDSANTCKWPQSNSAAGSAGAVLLEGESENNTFLGTLEEESPCVQSDNHGILAIFFISLLGVGIGQTAAYNLGIPYIDDNVDNRETPIYFAGTSGVRILGPTLGFVLGSVCTRLYVNPLTDPGITTSDPRWIGAWWLGLVIVSVALFLTSAAMFAFPRRLPSSPKSVRKAFRTPRRNPALRDFPKAVRRLLKNEILMLRTASSVLHILPIAGLYTFLPKYLESQFRLPVHSAAMVSGIGGILVMGFGIVASGLFIRKVKPKARAVAGWIALTALVYSIGMVILMFVGCEPDDIVGIVEDESGKHFLPQCNRTCGTCDDNMYAPVCDSYEKTHFSACHLGCSRATHIEGSNKLQFSNCDCLADGTAELRLCELNCGNFVWYVIIFSFFVLIHSTSEVGGMMVTLRCVDPKDKAMALGLISVAIGLFGNVPCPIIYGAVVDSACIQWKERCREFGACELYDSNIFRKFFHGMTGAVMLLAFMVDVVVWHKAKAVSFDEDDDGPEEATLMNPKSLSQSPSTPAITEQTPTTSTAQEITPVGSTSEGEASVSHDEDQSESCV